MKPKPFTSFHDLTVPVCRPAAMPLPMPLPIASMPPTIRHKLCSTCSTTAKDGGFRTHGSCAGSHTWQASLTIDANLMCLCLGYKAHPNKLYR